MIDTPVADPARAISWCPYYTTAGRPDAIGNPGPARLRSYVLIDRKGPVSPCLSTAIMVQSAHNKTPITEGTAMTYNYSKTFFSKKRAESFQAELKAQGINADIWTGADYLNHGSTLYYVKWNLD